jgi:hypothetical protein
MGLKFKVSFLGLTLFAVLGGGLALAQPHTGNYSLQSYGFGSGGTPNSGTASYSLSGISGDLSGQTAATSNYDSKPGYTESQQANAPKITLTNPSSYYDKLRFVIDQQNNPSDAKYALQISTTSDFSSNIFYVKSDNTIGGTLNTADYQTYPAWGGAGGANIIGLSSNTIYYIRAKATQGQFTESAYGPSSSAATVGQQISFCLYTSGSCAGGGNSVSLDLLPNTVAASGDIGVDFSTNADSGGNVYIYSNGSLTSTTRPGTPINSGTAGAAVDLSSVSKGYGARIVTATSMAKEPPYNQSGNVVGSLSTTIQTLLSASGPVSSTGNQLQLQAKFHNLSNAANDYVDTVTVVAAAVF